MKESFFNQTMNKWDILLQALFFMLLAVLQVFEFNFITFLFLGIGLAGSVIFGIKSKQLNRQMGNSELNSGYRFNTAINSPIFWFYIATSFSRGTETASAFSTVIVILVLGNAIYSIHRKGYRDVAQTSHLYLSVVSLSLWRILKLEPIALAMLLAFCGIIQGGVALYYFTKMKKSQQE